MVSRLPSLLHFGTTPYYIWHILADPINPTYQSHLKTDPAHSLPPSPSPFTVTRFTSTKRASRSLLVKTLMKRCRMTTRASSSTTGLASLDYWLGHDLSTNTVANGGWLLHARRVKHFAIAVNRY